MLTTIDDNVIQLAIEATSGHVDGWNQQRAQEQLREIKKNTKSTEIKKYITGVLAKTREE